MTERIVSVALQVFLPYLIGVKPSGPMIFSKPAPARHHDLIHQIAHLIDRPVLPDEQGFLTSAGRYVDRQTAKVIAIHAGQVTETRSDHLFSEDLW